VTSGLTLGGRISSARVKEFPTDVDSARQAVDASLRTRRYRLSPVLSVSEVIGARHARYDAGLSQTVVALETTLHYQPSSRLSLDLGYLRRTATGETPFEFDRMQIARELRSGVNWVISPVWRVSFDGRFDLERERFRDADITVSKTAHCLIYSLKWRQIRREFSFGVGLTQFAPD
jgi:LPS-assembly protein